MKNLYSQFVKPGDLVFDIGAEAGRRTDIFLELGARVVAIEPERSRAAELRERLGSNDKAVVVESAVGASPCVGKLLVGPDGRLPTLSEGWAKALKKRWPDELWSDWQDVAVITLDYLIEGYGKPSFIKIDIEGYEYEALKGLSTPIDALSFEFTLGYMESTWKCLLRLEQLGMTHYNYTLKEEAMLQLPVWVEPFNLFGALESLPWEAHYGDIFVKRGL